MSSNNVNLSEINKIESCQYSFPNKLLNTLTFKPTHFFLAKFKDGSYENFCSNTEPFYEKPENKSLRDIVEVFDSQLILNDGNKISLKNLSDWKNNVENFKKIHYNKPYFQCYLQSGMYAKNFQDELINIRERYKQ